MNKLHPLKPDMQRQMYYDQSNISHIVTKVHWEGLKLKGEVETANTQRGKDFKGLIDQGSLVAFSLRAVGPVVENKGDHVIVKDPLTMFCFDWVVHPSHACAYMDRTLQESANAGSLLKSESGLFIPISESVVDYAKLASRNFKLITKSFDVKQNTVTLSEDGRNLIGEVNDPFTKKKIIIKLEEGLQREINSFYKML